VNLIGEHIDYAGLPVFPMAIPQGMTACFRPREDRTVRIVNADRRYGRRAFTLADSLRPYADGDWGNYLKAAAQALERRYGPLSGLDAVIESSLPVAAGLSSSSALVVTVAVSLLHASGVTVPTTKLAHELAEAEQFVGTRGGGMDQAICLGAVSGCASIVEFDPLRLSPIEVPTGWRFVVASTLMTAEKSGAMQEAYNSRRRATEEALYAVIAHLDTPRGVGSYRELLVELTPADVDEIAHRVLSGALIKRFRHVVTEALRVESAAEAMRVGNLEQFGLLMNQSHASLRDDYDVSTPELDRLTEIACRAGAAGARLTGAGFGGCVVALVDEPLVSDVCTALRTDFYETRPVSGPIHEHLFVAAPSGGATVTSLS
jgi:galactokinase